MRALRSMTNLLGSQDYEGEESYEGLEQSAVSEYSEGYVDDYAPAETYEELAEPSGVDLRRIVTVHPSNYNEARVIGEAFRDGLPVIVNLTGMSEPDARRMVDFSAGLVFGLHGAIERVTPRVFLLTPATVSIESGEAAEAGDRFFNQG
ncbi:Cell division protein SepF [Actinomyces bovis]|uniref:Cell division protein SepF n=1 Tax=Actinomyces bovis TaxID=1658 RepID=A0ABY1VR82_9ACTO|nr:cell division protein SepF [Actinomyces bovis]SPT53937.1 Cell division protein SepF [Actinomyces bovis]VEG53439.1 Cell division protein SepF [Actinomyces israelii]